MNLYFVQWKQRDPDYGTKIMDCCRFVMASNEAWAKWTVKQIEFCRPFGGGSFTATLIQSEAELLTFCKRESFNCCFVEDERDYTAGADWDNPKGDFLTCNLLPQEPQLIDQLREQWRQEANEQRARDLQIPMLLTTR